MRTSHAHFGIPGSGALTALFLKWAPLIYSKLKCFNQNVYFLAVFSENKRISCDCMSFIIALSFIAFCLYFVDKHLFPARQTSVFAASWDTLLIQLLLLTPWQRLVLPWWTAFLVSTMLSYSWIGTEYQRQPFTSRRWVFTRDVHLNCRWVLFSAILL